jgi:triphosphoribosyl-dephospho-CoA synthase
MTLVALNVENSARHPWVARLATQALLAEAELTPKPGLVDRRGSGAHTDLTLDVMRRSALAIQPHFCRMARTAAGARPSQSLREQLAAIGRQAEQAMLTATGGSNAHKGAIWALGLLVSAVAMQGGAPAAIAAAIAAFKDRALPRPASHGDAVARHYGVSGARGEALNGFPHVVDVALPTLHRRRAEGATEEVARLDALLDVMSRLDDTCLLYRGGAAALSAAKAGAAAVALAGGAGTERGKKLLERLDRRLLELNASPGGSADMLAAALFLDAVERQQEEIPHGAH